MQLYAMMEEMKAACGPVEEDTCIIEAVNKATMGTLERGGAAASIHLMVSENLCRDLVFKRLTALVNKDMGVL